MRQLNEFIVTFHYVAHMIKMSYFFGSEHFSLKKHNSRMHSRNHFLEGKSPMQHIYRNIFIKIIDQTIELAHPNFTLHIVFGRISSVETCVTL